MFLHNPTIFIISSFFLCILSTVFDSKYYQIIFSILSFPSFSASIFQGFFCSLLYHSLHSLSTMSALVLPSCFPSFLCILCIYLQCFFPLLHLLLLVVYISSSTMLNLLILGWQGNYIQPLIYLHILNSTRAHICHSSAA